MKRLQHQTDTAMSPDRRPDCERRYPDWRVAPIWRQSITYSPVNQTT